MQDQIKQKRRIDSATNGGSRGSRYGLGKSLRDSGSRQLDQMDAMSKSLNSSIKGGAAGPVRQSSAASSRGAFGNFGDADLVFKPEKVQTKFRDQQEKAD